MTAADNTDTPATASEKEIAETSSAVENGEYIIVKFICDSGAVGHVISDPSLCSSIHEIEGVINITGVDQSTLFSTNKLGSIFGKVGDSVVCLDQAMIRDRAWYNILSLRQFSDFGSTCGPDFGP